MTGIEIKRLNELSFDRTEEVAQFMLKEFKSVLNSICKQDEALVRLLHHAIEEEQCFVALDNGKIIGMVGVSTPVKGALEVSLKETQKFLGLIDGLKFYFTMVKTGVRLQPYQIYINTLAVDEMYRRHKVATRLLEECMQKSCATEYLLDVLDVNTAAIRLYESMGFKVFKRKKQLFAKQAGFNEWLYMSKHVK